jgi:hypothetical protein
LPEPIPLQWGKKIWKKEKETLVVLYEDKFTFLEEGYTNRTKSLYDW